MPPVTCGKSLYQSLSLNLISLHHLTKRNSEHYVNETPSHSNFDCYQDPELSRKSLYIPCLLGASSACGKGHEEGGLAYAKVGSSLRSSPGNSRALPPKPESAYFLLCAFTYTSDFTGGCPPLPLSEKRVSLQLQLIIPGCDSVSTYKLLWKSSSLPE